MTLDPDRNGSEHVRSAPSPQPPSSLGMLRIPLRSHRLRPGRPARWPVLALAVGLLLGCSDPTVSPDPALAKLVGNWDAERFELTSEADAAVHVDLVVLGATYFINIQPSGGYTSTLTFQGTACTELGTLSAPGPRLVFRVETSTCATPRTDSATFEVDGDRLAIEGRTVFDFDLDGSSEDARLDAVLDRR